MARAENNTRDWADYPRNYLGKASSYGKRAKGRAVRCPVCGAPPYRMCAGYQGQPRFSNHAARNREADR